jgi:hypothetical protein
LVAGGSPPFTIAAAPCFAKRLLISFGQYQNAGKLRECFSGGKVLKAPENVVVLIVTAARNMVICNPALAVSLNCGQWGMMKGVSRTVRSIEYCSWGPIWSVR